MVDIETPPSGDFLLLETINKDKTTTRTIHVLMPGGGKTKFKLGRGHESDARIADISVSRFHAQISCTPEGYILEDNHSKFGTLVLERAPVVLELDKTKAVQVGRTLIHLTMRPIHVEPAEDGPVVATGALQWSQPGPAGQGKSSSDGAGNNDDGPQIDDIPNEDEN